MKYAKFVNTKKVDYNRIVSMVNMGDDIQSFAIDNLFNYCDIKQNDVIEIPMYLRNIIQEPCYLIAQGHYGRQYDFSFTNHPNIHPIFIGFALKDSFLLQKEVEYFKKFEPILCRDEFTKMVFMKYDIEAYISGCLSLTFAKRDNKTYHKRDKYYFVDVSEEFQKLIPEEIKQRAVFTSQNIPIDTMGDLEYIEKMISGRIAEYKSNAKMIITSKLHCMSPSIAMGIPTIAVGNNLSYRYSFVDAFIEAYDEKRFGEYDWSIPKEKVDIEIVKKLLLDVGKSMIERHPDMNKIQQLDDIYSNRSRWIYCQGIKEKLKEIFKNIDSPKYILWGASSGGYAVNAAVKELWPNSELVDVVDTFAEGVFAGKEIQKPREAIGKHPNTTVIVSTLSGQKCAETLLQEMEKKEGKDYFVLHENL